MDTFRARLDQACQNKDLLVPRFVSCRSIPDRSASDYIARFRPNSREYRFVETVLAMTRYIPHGELMVALEKSFQRFSAAIGNTPFYVYFPLDHFDIENIMILHMWDKLRELNIVGFITEGYDDVNAWVRLNGFTKEISGGTHVLIIDDAIYTGISSFNTMDWISFNNMGRHGEDNPIHFHFVVPFVSSNGKKIMQNLRHFTYRQFITATLYEQEVIPSYGDIDPYYTEEFAGTFGLEYTGQMAVYFDHKVANEFSTFNPIYMDVRGRHGSLLPILPDVDLNSRVWSTYFSDLMGPPHPIS